MSADDTPEGERGEQSVDTDDTVGEGEERIDSGESEELVGSDVRERLGEGAGKAVDQFDEGLIDLLAWMLETETRARIYINLRKEPNQTSDEIAEGTGLYPSTVREALASLHDDTIVIRDKRQNAGAGNNPYEYSAIPPSDLVSEVVDDIQEHLNAVFNLDNYMDRDELEDVSSEDTEPVTITVTEQTDTESPEESATEDGKEPADRDNEISDEPEDSDQFDRLDSGDDEETDS